MDGWPCRSKLRALTIRQDSWRVVPDVPAALSEYLQVQYEYADEEAFALRDQTRVYVCRLRRRMMATPAELQLTMLQLLCIPRHCLETAAQGVPLGNHGHQRLTRPRLSTHLLINNPVRALREVQVHKWNCDIQGSASYSARCLCTAGSRGPFRALEEGNYSGPPQGLERRSLAKQLLQWHAQLYRPLG